MEYQIRLIDDRAALDLPLEEQSSGWALIKAHKVIACIQERYADRYDSLAIRLHSLTEVIRHGPDYIELRPIWIDGPGFVDPAHRPHHTHRKISQ